MRRALDDAAALSDRCAGGPVASGAVEVEDAAEAATGRDGCGMMKFFRRKKLRNLGRFQKFERNCCRIHVELLRLNHV